MKKAKYLLAVGVGVLPIYLIMIWYRLAHQITFTPFEMLGYPLIFGGGNILVILLLNSYLLRGSLKDFNAGKGSWQTDTLAAVVLTVVYFSLNFVEQRTLAGWLPAGPPPSPELFDMLRELTNNPVLLAIWLGPVVWIGVALFEEISRTFFLNCLWKLSKNEVWTWVVILLSAVLIGGAHIYQGLFGFVSIGIKSLVMGAYYYRYRRIWPLIISHALYDSIQVVYLVSVL
jgi:membrane protease YdiL (CAAX protease family)